MRKLKVTFVVFMFAILVGIFIGGNTTFCNAKTIKKSDMITINKKNFPDKRFKKYVKNSFDKNKDGKLSKKEIKKVKKIQINSDSCAVEKLSKFNCKGIQYFTNVKKVDIEIDSRYYEKGSITNIKYLMKLKKIKKLHLTGNLSKKKLDLSSLKNLKTLVIVDSNIKKINLKKNSKLTKIDLWQNYYIKKVDLSKNKKLKYVICNHNRISDIKLPEKNVIEKLSIAINPIQDIDVNILNPDTLTELEIHATLIEEIDVSRLVNLKRLETYKKGTLGTEVIKGENQEFEHIIDDADYYEYSSKFFF